MILCNYSLEDRFKAFEYKQMSLLLRVPGFYLLNSKKKAVVTILLRLLRSQFTNSCGPQRKRFHRGKIIVFYYHHCYLSILALLSIEIIALLGTLSCR